jgi:tetratricopeptide (TPR) repeat protein
VLVVLLVALGAPRAAGAGSIQLIELAAEPDVRPEAGAISLVLESVLVASGATLAREKADLVVRGAVLRHGTQLLALVRATDPRGLAVASWRVTAAAGDVAQAGHAIAARVLALDNGKPVDAPEVSLAELRPYVAARHAVLAGDQPAATAALDEADPRVAARLPAAASVRAEAEAKAGPRDPAEAEVTAAAAAHERGDGGTRDRLLAPLLARSFIPALRLVATLPPAAMGPALEESALAAAATLGPARPGLSSRLAYRAAVGGADPAKAMPLIRAAEHGRPDLEKLVPFVDAAVKAKVPASVRLRAELKLLSGDRSGAEADLRATLTSDPRDRIALHHLARILTDRRDYTGAATALRVSAESGDPAVRRELARALAQTGDRPGSREILVAMPDPTSAESQVALATQAQEAGLRKQALEHLARARALAPDDPGNLRALAEVYKASGDVARTVEMLGLAERISQAEEVALVEAIAGLPVAAAEEVALPKAAAAADTPAKASELRAKPSPLSLELAQQLLGFETLPASAGRRVLVIERAGSRPSVLWPLRVYPDILAETLAKTLAGAPFRTQPVVARGSTATPAEDTLRSLATRDGAEQIIVYDVQPVGLGGAVVRLLLFDAPSGRSFELSREVDGLALELVAVKPIYLATVLLVLAALLAWFAWVVVIGSGEIDVSIKFDPETAGQIYDVVVSRSAVPPAIPDVRAWLATHQATAPAKTKLRATHVGLQVRFPKVTTGSWHVHLIGTHDRGADTELLAPASQPVKVPRRGVVKASFDLVPTVSQVRITVMDGQKPVAAARVAVDEGGVSPVFTNGEGHATLALPKGHHTLLVAAGGMNLERKLQISDTRTRTVTLNVERERRLASIGDVKFSEEAVEEPIIDHSLVPQEVVDPPAPVAFARTQAASGSSPAEAAAAGGVRTKTFYSGSARPVSAPPARPTMSITGLSRYQPIEEIGRGAMATVFKARDMVLEREVALKMISDEVRQYPVALQLFLQEGKALAALNHPNIVTVFDQGRDGDQYYIVMELVSGTTLERIVEGRGGLTVVEAMDTIDQLCSGLSYAHGRRVVHRDIKPGNIFVNGEGVVKLGDFGLARVIHEVKIKRTDVRGTPLYMAPEQIRGQDIDFRADLYSVGCTLYELLTGQAPFSVGEILYHHLHTEPPRPSDLVPALPPELDDLVLSCLQKDARARIASADAIRAALRPLIRKYAG